MNELIRKLNALLNKMCTEGAIKTEIDFHDLSRIYQMLNMMKQIIAISDWCKEGYE